MKDKILELEMLYDQLTLKQRSVESLREALDQAILEEEVIQQNITRTQTELSSEVNTLLGMCKTCGKRMEGKPCLHGINGGKR